MCSTWRGQEIRRDRFERLVPICRAPSSLPVSARTQHSTTQENACGQDQRLRQRGRCD